MTRSGFPATTCLTPVPQRAPGAKVTPRVRTGRTVWAAAAILGALLLLALLGSGGPVAAQRAAAPPAPPAAVGTYLHEDFEGGAVGNSVFTDSVVLGAPTPTGTAGWAVESAVPHSGAYSAYAPAVDGVADQRLRSLYPVAIPTNATAATLTFWHGTSLAFGGDGAVLEFSTDDGTTWSSGVPAFLSGGYDEMLGTGGGNPLGGRDAWTGVSGGWIETQVDLLGYAGQRLLLRFRLGTDSHPAPGVFGVDDVAVTITAPCDLGNWDTSVLPYPSPVALPGVASLAGRVYSFGGSSGASAAGALAIANRYDPSTHLWSALAGLPTALYAPVVASDGSYLYVIGGLDHASVSRAEVWRYDPAANTYLARAALPVGVAATGAAYLDGKIYVVGGATDIGTFTFTDIVQVYDVATNTWSTTAAAYPGPIGLPAVSTALGRILVAGGISTGYVPVTYAASYDPAANSWSDGGLADLPAPRFGAGSGIVGTRWVLAGGVANRSELTSTIALDLATGHWGSQPPLPSGRFGPGAGVAGGALYLVGGTGPAPPNYATVLRFSVAACVLPSPTPGPATATPAAGSPTPTETVCPLTFRDVHSTDYFYEPVLYLACHGVISGYADGTFRPYNNTTRAQQVKIVVLGFGKPIVTPMPGSYTFADVPPGAPFFDVIETAAADAIVSGYACGGPGEPCDSTNRPYFRPNANVTRGQLSKIDAVAAGWLLLNPANNTFADVPEGSPFYTFVETAACRSVISGYACGGPGEPCDPAHRPYLRPGANATRGQIAKIVYLSLSALACGP